METTMTDKEWLAAEASFFRQTATEIAAHEHVNVTGPSLIQFLNDIAKRLEDRSREGS